MSEGENSPATNPNSKLTNMLKPSPLPSEKELAESWLPARQAARAKMQKVISDRFPKLDSRYDRDNGVEL